MPVEAEEAARPVILRRPRQGVDAGGVQRHRHGLAGEGGQGLPFEVDGNRLAAGLTRRQIAEPRFHDGKSNPSLASRVRCVTRDRREGSGIEARCGLP